ncbi:hypothetical protein [Methylobacterium brachythecii]|nr:hypothetical protein [Methylobacterium brachythecii]MBB3905309.1 hypothetical protein [Methylobacterium brachythecii]
MLTSLLSIIGFTKAPPPRPPSRRRVAPVSKPVVAAPAPRLTDDERSAMQERLAARAEEAAAQRQADADRRFAVAVRRVVRHHSGNRVLSPEELAAAEAGVGAETLEYLRACRLAGIQTPILGDDRITDRVRTAAYRADLLARAQTDAEGWDRAWVALLKAQADARRVGDPEPAGLVIPGDVQNLIAKLHADRLARLTRRQGGQAGQGGTAASTIPGAVVPPKGPTDGRKDGPEDDEPEPVAPAGPKR